MFSGLRTSSIFYVLEKGEEPTLKIGQVVSVSNPQPKFPTYQPGQFSAFDLNENAVLVVSLYVLAYVVLPVVLLPASFLFKFGWVWRIPFLYLAGVILIRIGHGTLCISETTRIADYTLIFLTMLLYGRAFTLQDK